MAVLSVFAMPLGDITNELITNSAKYAEGNVTVRLETSSTKGHSLSVSDAAGGWVRSRKRQRTRYENQFSPSCNRLVAPYTPDGNGTGALFTTTLIIERVGGQQKF